MKAYFALVTYVYPPSVNMRGYSLKILLLKLDFDIFLTRVAKNVHQCAIYAFNKNAEFSRINLYLHVLSHFMNEYESA